MDWQCILVGAGQRVYIWLAFKPHCTALGIAFYYGWADTEYWQPSSRILVFASPSVMRHCDHEQKLLDILKYGKRDAHRKEIACGLSFSCVEKERVFGGLAESCKITI